MGSTELRPAAQQALEILERLHGGCTDSDDGTVEAITVWCPEIIDALRAALAEPVQDTDEQVLDAMGQRIGYGRVQQIAGQLWDARHGCAPRGSMGVTVKDAAAPAPQRPAEPVQEPVGVVTSMVKGGVTWHRWPSDMPDGTTLYTAPPQRKPLTEEEIEKAYREIWRDLPSDFDHTSAGWIEMGIKYAERAHGIGGQP